MFSCCFCQRLLMKKSGQVLHQNACKNNPNRVPQKNSWSNPSYKLSDDTRRKLSEATTRKNFNMSDETRKKISDARRKFLRENPDKTPYKLSHYSKGPSYPEVYWKKVLLEKNMKFEEEFSVGTYSLDFAFLDAKIDLEIDGEQHYVDPRVVKSDIKRTLYLEQLGWTTIRIRWSKYQGLSEADKKLFVTDLIEKINNG